MRYFLLFSFLALCVFVRGAVADGITVGGSIYQSTADGTGPAVNNPSLNNISDGDAYTVTLNFSEAITAPGTYNLSSGTLVFSDATASAVEDNFGSISLTISVNGSSNEFSLLGCLTTGDGCLVGNYLAMNFAIPSADLNSTSATAIPFLTPLDLLEDDGSTDIQGTVTSYSYTSPPVASPEPSAFVLLCCGLILLAWSKLR
jgi:hypothetical protein